MLKLDVGALTVSPPDRESEEPFRSDVPLSGILKARGPFGPINPVGPGVYYPVKLEYVLQSDKDETDGQA